MTGMFAVEILLVAGLLVSSVLAGPPANVDLRPRARRTAWALSPAVGIGMAPILTAGLPQSSGVDVAVDVLVGVCGIVAGVVMTAMLLAASGGLHPTYAERSRAPIRWKPGSIGAGVGFVTYAAAALAGLLLLAAVASLDPAASSGAVSMPAVWTVLGTALGLGLAVGITVGVIRDRRHTLGVLRYRN
jgi:hypothetical protein